MTLSPGLAGVDLNLLVAFDALMAERHLSRAAARVGLSQPGLSHALRRLRNLTGDVLFERHGRMLTPTARALALEAPISAALHQVQAALLGPEAFDARTAHRTFRIAISDLGAFSLLPGLLRTLRSQAPQVDLRILPTGAAEGFDQVFGGEADLGIGVHPNLPHGVSNQVLVSTRLVCIADSDNPCLRNGLDMQAFLDLPHVAVAIGESRGSNIDALLDMRGLRRRVMLTVPYFVLVPPAVRGTDLIAVVPPRVMQTQGPGGLKAHQLPVDIPEVTLRMIWLDRRGIEPDHIWLRQEVARAYDGASAAESAGLFD